MRVLTLLLTLGVGGFSSAQEPGPADAFEKQTFQGEGFTLPYRFLKPARVEPGRKYPLVLFLHGAGERGTDNEKQLVHGVKMFANEAMQKRYPCFVVVPQCPEKTMWVDIPWDSPQPKMPATPNSNHVTLIGLLDKVEMDFPIDPDRRYVTGLSMGGFGTLEMVVRHPERFAAAAPVCGGSDLSRLPVASKLPFWFFHGAKDTVVRVERSREAVAVLKKAGAEPRYTEYPDVAHDSWNKAYATPELYEWLFAQKRPAAP